MSKKELSCSKSKNHQALGIRPQTPSRPSFSFNDYSNVQNPTPIEHFWLMQMLGNLGAKRNLYLLPLPPLPV